jgi:hypothetical protein
MLEIQRENGIHFVSDAFSRPFLDQVWSQYALKHADYLLKALVRRRLFKQAIALWSEVNNLRGYIMLEAHGVDDNHEWRFIDEGIETSVQKWVDERDGQVASIIIVSCNPYNYNLVSEKSILVYLTQVTNLPDALRYGYARIYIPRMGHFDKDYRGLRRAVDKLEQLRLGLNSES